jgi:hypothetical protein
MPSTSHLKIMAVFAEVPVLAESGAAQPGQDPTGGLFLG